MVFHFEVQGNKKVHLVSKETIQNRHCASKSSNNVIQMNIKSADYFNSQYDLTGFGGGCLRGRNLHCKSLGC